MTVAKGWRDYRQTVVPVPFDQDALLADIGRLPKLWHRPPPGGWDQWKLEYPDRWQRLITAMSSVDQTFSQQDVAGCQGSIRMIESILSR